MVKVLLAFLFFIPITRIFPTSEYTTFEGRAQGTTYKMVFRRGGTVMTVQEVDSILRTIDRSLSLWEPGSLINAFNTSDREVGMDLHMSRVVHRALEVTRASYGSFDITIKPYMDAWGLGVRSRADAGVPSREELSVISRCVGSGKLLIRKGRLIKRSPCTQIDANGIAQGYSVDVLADWLERAGVRDYLVELGGEIRASGTSPKGKPWTVGVEAAANDKDGEAGISATLQPGYGGITTAGNYRKYVESGGKRFSHIMDPRTGFPVNNGIVSVTVRAATAMDADAWDDALMVLGVDSSFQLLAKHPELQARFILATPEGGTRDTATAGFFVPAERPSKLP